MAAVGDIIGDREGLTGWEAVYQCSERTWNREKLYDGFVVVVVFDVLR